MDYFFFLSDRCDRRVFSDREIITDRKIKAGLSKNGFLFVTMPRVMSAVRRIG